MDRYWLITWTTYGNWLPGDARGFAGNVREPDRTQVVHNAPDTPYDANMPGLTHYVREHMTGPPVELDLMQAKALIPQYLETASVRKWSLEAASVMYNHTHIVVGVLGDPDPDSVRRTFVSWATRTLKKLGPVPVNGTWWTAKGSERKLPDETAVRGAVIYVVKKQPNPFAVYAEPKWQEALDQYDAQKASKSASRSVR